MAKYFLIDIHDVDEGTLTPGDIGSVQNWLSIYARNTLRFSGRLTVSKADDKIHSGGTTTPKIRVDSADDINEATILKLASYAVFILCIWRLNIPPRPFMIETEPDPKPTSI